MLSNAEWMNYFISTVELKTKEYLKICKDFTITDKAPTRAFSWFETQLRHYAKQGLTHGK